jgi:hypothetical protein
METNNFTQNYATNFHCPNCNFVSSRKNDYNRHILTLKHKRLINANDFTQNYANQNSFVCDCGKQYKHLPSLYKHKKVCEKYSSFNNNNIENNNNNNNNNIELLTNLVQTQIKENKELLGVLQEQNKIMFKMTEYTGSTITNSNINSNNKTFNLNVFLKEQCKDAMNIMDFVDSLKLQLSDLENVGKLGFVEGISNIIVKNLKALDIHKRPVHCSDSKREVMYIKDEDKWEKENDEKLKLRKAIKHIAHKNSKLIPQFKEKYPDCGKSDSKYSDQYNKLVIEAMGGSGNEDTDNENKIIKKIAKEVVIEKI